MDKLTKDQRSRNMRAIRSANNKSTELLTVKALKRLRITGWRRGQKNIYGKPDFVLSDMRTAVFIDGCFWHGCPVHGTIPKSNRAFWRSKIAKNRKRDQTVSRELRKQGWKVIRIWEHDTKDTARITKKLTTLLKI